jgi:hypothetical protein
MLINLLSAVCRRSLYKEDHLDETEMKWKSLEETDNILNLNNSVTVTVYTFWFIQIQN